VPIFAGVRELMEKGYVPGGLYRNKNFRISQIEKADTCPDWILDVLFDPQTAGGLFFSISAKDAQSLIEKMHRDGIADAAIVGKVVSDNLGKIVVY
jgi:Selenophosphate synthase